MMSASQSDWLDIGPTAQIDPGMAATLPVEGGEEIAVFHTIGGEFYALINKCPHKQGPLSQGIVHENGVTCPLHNWVIDMETGRAKAPDEGRVRTFPVEVRDGRVLIDRTLLA